MVVIKVQNGQLRGKNETLPNGGSYISFKGIPYAKPPIGALRFKAPQPLDSWEGIKDAFAHGSQCAQLDPLIDKAPKGDDNCLYLNVYTPSTDSKSKIPVMVWIHGGAFFAGSGDSSMYGPEFLLEKNVIIVTINYRVGVFGFLCLDNLEVPGNAGMKDQVAALKWIKENVGNFGGDPDEITIFGESAGGASVSMLIMSPLSRGLFNKAIAQSGSALADWAVTGHGRSAAFELGKLLGKETDKEDELLEFLRGVPSYDLVLTAFKLNIPEGFVDNLLFVPVVEKQTPVSEAFLTKLPIEYIVAGEAADIPFITGVTSGEGIVALNLSQLELLDKLNSFHEMLLTKEIRNIASPEVLKLKGKEIKEAYFGDKLIGETTVKELMKFKSDFMFVYPSYRLCNLLAAINKSPVYYYYFNYTSPYSVIGEIIKGSYKEEFKDVASHVEELEYLFNASILPQREMSESDVKIRNVLTTLWTNFAKTGNPTFDDGLGVKWTKYSSDLQSFFVIDNPLKPKHSILPDRMEHWDSLYKQFGLPC